MSFLRAGQNFFHYTTGDAAFGHILPTRQLRLSRYGDMRDPLEYKEWFLPGSFSGGISDEAGETWEEFNAALAQRRANARLLSLSVDAPEDPDREPFYRGWSRGRMWEQYAANHTGVCLVFDRAALTTTITDSLSQQGAGSLY